MKRSAPLLFLFCLALSGSNFAADDSPPRWKALQVTHFTLAPGVSPSKDAADRLYGGLRDELRQRTLAGLFVEDGAVVPLANAADSVIVQGKITLFREGTTWRAARAQLEVDLCRASDHRLLKTFNKGMYLGHIPSRPEDWGKVGLETAREVAKSAKDIPPLASFAPVAPSDASVCAVIAPPPPTPVAAAASQPSSNAEALTNNSVIEMAAAKLPDEVIIAKIQTSTSNFDLSTPGLVELNQKGVSPAVMKAMMMAPKGAPASLQSPATLGAAMQNPGTAPMKHFTITEGANFPTRFDPQVYLALFPSELHTQLQRRKVHVQLVGEGASAPDAGATAPIVVDSVTLTGFSKDIGWLASPAIITIETRLLNTSDHTLFKTVTSRIQAIGGEHAKGLPLYDVKNLATWTANWVANDIRKAVK